MTDAVNDAVEPALADMWYVEESLTDLVTTYRQAAHRYLDEYPEPDPWTEEAALQRVEAAVQAGRDERRRGLVQ